MQQQIIQRLSDGSTVGDLNHKVGVLEQQRKQLIQDKADLTTQVNDARVACDVAERKHQALANTHAALDTHHQALVLQHTELTQRWNALVAEKKKLVDDRTRIKMSGISLWETPAPPDAPAFRPLTGKAAPIIAVLNLKGGVGKTTITANLAGSLATENGKVLMVDLDYQGSLTSLCLDDSKVRDSYHQKQMVQDYFRTMGSSPETFHQYIVPLAKDPGRHCDVVPCSDDLEDIETR